MTMKIYLVEDDAVIAGHVARHLEAWGYQVKTAEDFRNILGEFQAFQPQLVLLDIALPFFNGYHWCTEIRKVSRVPIIFLSSVSDNMNIVTAMDLGGDDFVYYFAHKAKRRTVEKSEYSRAWREYWSDKKSGMDSYTAIYNMIVHYGGVARKQAVPTVNAIYGKKIDEMLSYIEQSIENEIFH